MNKMPERYEVEFADDKAVYIRSDGEIDTKTEIFVATDDDAEIRKLTLKNNSDTVKTIEITSYCEIVLAPRAADQAHMVFSNLFVETDYHAQSGMVSAPQAVPALDGSGWTRGPATMRVYVDSTATQGMK
jgi:cyclic beta-1,2-glucan synthetase